MRQKHLLKKVETGIELPKGTKNTTYMYLSLQGIIRALWGNSDCLVGKMAGDVFLYYIVVKLSNTRMSEKEKKPRQFIVFTRVKRYRKIK